MPSAIRDRHYLDHAATTPLRPQALTAMHAAWEAVGNPSSLHASGRRARAILEDAREQLADAVGAHPAEVVFTAGGTEADGLVIAGGALWGAGAGRPRVAASTVEHPAVLHGLRALGDRAVWLGVDADGVVTGDALASLRGEVAWASLMAVNNETGALQPLAAFVEACRRAGVRAHSDAVQALGHVPLSFADSGLDAMSLSAHKAGGPVGVGALIARRDAPLAVVSHGGGQERRLRSGTVPVALAAGFAAAAAASVAELDAEAVRLAGLRTRLVGGLTAVDGVRVNGPALVSPAICHVTVAGTRADDILFLLDAAGIDCSTGSACTAGVHQPSEVLLAMGRSEADASASVRFSLGWTTTAADIDAVLADWPDAVARARAAFA
ncbi:MAG: cysteine desulfurase family protein [Propioniciclava sp.]|uniref:cysteine desulfurase family protein n=1 Tax=Propioniciclava sp. TaxID=2038686 RepID=UPI0039E59EB1